MTTVDRRPITEWFLQLLEKGTSRPVYRHDEIPASPEYPFAMVLPIEGGGFWGGELVTPDANADFVYQVDSVGVTEKSAEWMADAVRRTVLARDRHRFQVRVDAPAGYGIADRTPSFGPGGPMPSEPGVAANTPSVVSWPERFVIRVVGA